MVYFLLMLFSGFIVGGIIGRNTGGIIIGVIGCVVCILIGVISAYKRQKATREKIVDAMVQLAVDEVVEEVMQEVTYSAILFNNKINNLKKNENAEAYFTVSEITSMIVNLLDAKKVLNAMEYKAVYKIYEVLSKKNEKLLLTLDDYMDLCQGIVAHFDMVGPYHLFCGGETCTPLTCAFLDKEKWTYREQAKILIRQGKLFSREWQELREEFMDVFY